MPQTLIKSSIAACLGVTLRCSLAAAVLMAALGETFAGTSTLPYADNFENYTNGAPLVDGTNGWYGSSRSIVVESNLTIGASGTNSAMVPVDCTLSNRFTSVAPVNVWIQMDLRPMLYCFTNPPEVNTNVAWLFYLNSNGNFVVHDGPATNWVELASGGVGTNGTNW